MFDLYIIQVKIVITLSVDAKVFVIEHVWYPASYNTKPLQQFKYRS